MKVAIVFRGIPRYKPYELGRRLIEKLIIDRFPDCDFRVILQIPTLTKDNQNYKKTARG